MDKFKPLLFLFLFFLVACSKPQPVQQELVETEAAEYKIAVAAPQFGPYQALGLSIVYGAELAVDKKNQEGGIDGKKITLIKVDDGGLAGEGTWRARNLVSEMVLGVIGHLNSDISIPASEIYSMAMVAEISPGSTSPLFTERKPVRGYVFRTVGRDDQQGDIAAMFAVEKGFKNIAVLYNNRGYGLSLSTEFIKMINKNSQDVKVVSQEMYEVGNEDFSKQVNKIQEKLPDLIYFVGEYGDAARFLKQLKKLELNVAFLGSEGVFDQEFIKTAKDASEGAFIISLPETTDEEFVGNYRKKYGKELGSYSANSYDATNILILAIEKVQETNPVKIARAVAQTMNHQGLTGNITFDLKGDLVDPAFSIYEVKDGRFVAIR